MYARLSTYQGSPNSEDAQVEEGLRYAREEVLPRARQMDGFRGVISLLDRRSGKSLSVTLWASEEAMRASEEEANRLRNASATRVPGASRPCPTRSTSPTPPPLASTRHTCSHHRVPAAGSGSLAIRPLTAPGADRGILPIHLSAHASERPVWEGHVSTSRAGGPMPAGRGSGPSTWEWRADEHERRGQPDITSSRDGGDRPDACGRTDAPPAIGPTDGPGRVG